MDFLKPTQEQARQYATIVEAGLPGEMALEVLFPEIEPAVRPEMARQWERLSSVRAARFDAWQWATSGLPARVERALARGYGVLAAFIVTRGPMEKWSAEERNQFKFAMESLEKQAAGTAGKGDASSEFFRKVLAGEIKLGGQPAGTERVQ